MEIPVVNAKPTAVRVLPLPITSARMPPVMSNDGRDLRWSKTLVDCHEGGERQENRCRSTRQRRNQTQIANSVGLDQETVIGEVRHACESQPHRCRIAWPRHKRQHSKSEEQAYEPDRGHRQQAIYSALNQGVPCRMSHSCEQDEAVEQIWRHVLLLTRVEANTRQAFSAGKNDPVGVQVRWRNGKDRALFIAEITLAI
jgi:hypothetical protein